MTVLRNENRWDRSNVLFLDGKLLRYDNVGPLVGVAERARQCAQAPAES